MNISEIAKRTKLPAKSIRYYEEQGIIPKAKRSAAGYRVYTEEDEKLLQFVQKTRSLGFTLEETKQLLQLWRNPGRTSARVKKLVSDHLVNLEEKIRELEAMRGILTRLQASCQGNQNPECSILDELSS